MAHAKSGDVLENRRTEKARITVRRTAEETGGALLELEAEYAPGGGYPPEHLHPHQDEHFVVLRGAVAARLGGVERTYRAGDTLDIPRGTAHTMRAAGAEGAAVRWEIRPALRTLPFYEALWGLAAAGRTDAHGRPGLLQTAVLLHAFRDEFVLSAPPGWVQRLALPPLALLGRLLGLRAAAPAPRPAAALEAAR